MGGSATLVQISSACIRVHLRQNSFSTARSAHRGGASRAAGQLTSNEDGHPGVQVLSDAHRAIQEPPDDWSKQLCMSTKRAWRRWRMLRDGSVLVAAAFFCAKKARR